jgi:hypothetical protein
MSFCHNGGAGNSDKQKTGEGSFTKIALDKYQNIYGTCPFPETYVNRSGYPASLYRYNSPKKGFAQREKSAAKRSGLRGGSGAAGRLR